MSDNTKVQPTDEVDVELAPAAYDQSVVSDEFAGGSRLARLHRGMITVEYAIGIVMVIALVATIIVSINSGTFGTFSSDFAKLIMAQIKEVLTTLPGKP